MGRTPKPTKLKVLQGDREDRINRNEPEFSSELPPPPSYLTAEAKQVWQMVVAELGRFGLIQTPDAVSLEAYCQEVVTFRRASRDVNKRGVMVTGYRGSKVKNPSISVMHSAADRIRQFAREFGMTPASRSGLAVGEVKRDEGKKYLSS